MFLCGGECGVQRNGSALEVVFRPVGPSETKFTYGFLLAARQSVQARFALAGSVDSPVPPGSPGRRPRGPCLFGGAGWRRNRFSGQPHGGSCRSKLQFSSAERHRSQPVGGGWPARSTIAVCCDSKVFRPLPAEFCGEKPSFRVPSSFSGWTPGRGRLG